jgi:uncharacterized membrane protein
MTESLNPEPNTSNLFERLIKQNNLDFKDYLLIITLVCYISGFFITNMYLGSLGIVNLDLLRVRYILAGILFLLFLVVTVYPIYGVYKSIANDMLDSPIKTALGAIGYTYKYYSVFAFLLFISGLVFSVNLLSPIGLKSGISNLSISKWWISSNSELFSQTWMITKSMWFIFPLVLVVTSIIFVIFLLRTDRSSRKEYIKSQLKRIYEGFVYFLSVYIFVPVVTFTMNAFFSYLNFILTSNPNAQTSVNELNLESWLRFGLISFFVYLFFSIYLGFMAYAMRMDIKNLFKIMERVNLFNKDLYALSSLYIIANSIIVVAVIFIYSFTVYPYLPQQLGGGRAIPVKAEISNQNINTLFSNSSNETYLIDRTSGSTIFLISNNKASTIMEVSNSQMESITYLKSP